MKPTTTLIAAFLVANTITPVMRAQQPTSVPPEAFTVPEGLEVQLWASSPLLYNPTNMDVDQHGRIWVTEGVNYRGQDQRRKEGDRVVVLEDTDQDGKADKSTVFVQEQFLVSPLGIAVFDNVIVVSQPPDMIVYTDVNRDLKFDPAVDTREVRLTGFQGRNHDHSLHSVTAGPDGKWYWNSGNCGAVFTDKSGKTFRITSSYMDPEGVAGQKSDDGHVYVGGFTARMDPDGSNVEIIGHNYRNSYEQVVTSFGDVFQSDNDDPPACRVANVIEYGNAGFSSRDGQRSWGADRRRGQDTPTAHWRQEDPGTMPSGDVYGGGSPTGVAFYENGALGKQWPGLLLACEPGRNTVFGYLPVRDGAGFKLERMDWMTTNTEHQFVGSDFTGGRWDGKLNTQFRPSDVMVGADGAIYVADWFDGRVGGHQTLDDSLSGAIYRVAPKGFTPKIPAIDAATEKGAALALASPAVNVRNLGYRFLRNYKLGGKAVGMMQAAFADKTDPYVVARWIWLRTQVGPDDQRELGDESDPTLRIVRFRALRTAGCEVLPMAKLLSTDSDAAVRATVATALRDEAAEAAVPLLVEIGQRFDGEDRSYLDAFGIGCTGKESQVYAALAEHAGKDPLQWSSAMAWIAWRLSAPESVPALVTRAKATSLPIEERTRALTAIAFIRDKAAMEAMLAIAEDFDCSLSSQALLWCIQRMGNEWQPFGLSEILKENGMFDPDQITIQPVSTPPEPGVEQQITVAQVVALQGDANRGAIRAALCHTCHKVGNNGIAFGPDIVAFAKAQATEAVAEAILFPSKSISHGYEGHTVETDAGTIDGIVLSDGNPVMVQSQAGMLQMIPRSRVKKLRPLGRSLMWPSQMYGLDAQATADLIAYLKSQS